MVDVQQRALRPLEQHPLAALHRLVEQLPGRLGIGQDLRRDRLQRSEDLVRPGFRQAEAAAQGRVVRQQPVDLGLQRLAVGEVGDADRAAADLVLVGRADAAAGGADLVDRLGFAGDVELAVQGQDQRGVVGQHQHVGGDRDALRADPVDLGQQRPGIDDDAVADHRELALHDPRRQQRELVDLVADHQRVAGVVPALEAHHHVGPRRQPVHELALALVAPLGADHRHIGHWMQRPHPAGCPRPPFDRDSAAGALGTKPRGAGRLGRRRQRRQDDVVDPLERGWRRSRR